MPSDEDVRVGSPFSDGVGRILDMLLRKAGIRRDEVTMLNVIQCHPLDDKFPADVKAVHHCVRNHVLPVLHSKPWVRLDLIGEKALKFIGLQDGIARWRGSPIDVNVDDLEQKYTH
jgi:uracil-DNA glycosylase family 4